MSNRKIQTVLGDVDPQVLGRTLTHEHLAMDFSHFYSIPPKQLAEKFQDGFSMEKLGYLRQYPYSSKYNLIFNDEATRTAVMNDVIAYKKYGGGTIVENSTEGLIRDVNFLRDVSLKSGVHLVAGTGFYIQDTVTGGWADKGQEELYEHMVKELTVGCDGSDIRAGFIGEVASVWPIKELERKAIRASGEAQEQLGVGVSFHPHRLPDAPFEIIRLYLEAGGKADKAVMSHLDRTLLENDRLLEFADLGTYCQFDLFGVEVSYYQLNATTDMPSDAQRLDKIQLLLDAGKEDKVLMSHDIHTKHRLADFGGHGFSHILNNVLPRMTLRGVSQDVINKITISNPAEWLAIKH